MKNTKQVLAHPSQQPLNFGLFKVDYVGPLSDITQASDLPNFRLEVCSNKSHELGTLFLRVSNSTYDSDKHDYGALLEKVITMLRTDIAMHDLRLVPWGGLSVFDRNFSRPGYSHHMQWTPSQEDLLKFNAQALLQKANIRPMSVTYGGYYVVTNSSIAYQPDREGKDGYRFDLLLTDEIRFYAVPKDQVPGGIIPMPYNMGADLDPVARNEAQSAASAIQGEFSFQGKDYVFAFLHTLFNESFAGVVSQRLLSNALDAAIAKQFPFFMPPLGAQVGVKLIGLKFKE